MSTPFIGQTFTFTQPDGSALKVRGWGDQHYAVFETLDGYTVVKNPATGFWEKAQRSDDGTRLEPGGDRPDTPRGLRLNADSARAAGREGARRFGGRRCDERREERKRFLQAARAMAAAGGPLLAPPQRTTVGDYVGLCLLIEFSDAPATISRDEVERFCNQVGYNGFGNNGSVRDYFFDNSMGLLRYTNIVTPYYKARRPKSYYTDPNIEQGVRARELIREALTHWQANGFDFSNLTTDGRGLVYAMNVFYTGPVTNNWSEGLWPHAWMMGTPVQLTAGVSAFDYQVTAMGSELLLGTFCHENGHMLCDYPDLYDYGDQSAGVGMYCLMCAGNHANQRNPVQISAYLKRLSGWASQVINLQHGANVTLHAGKNEMAMFAKNNSEYFLLENRTKTSRDAALPDEGIFIWHVDEQGDNSNEQMTPENHYELSLEQADGLFELEKSRSERGDANDLYSGSSARFANDTKPSSKWWDGTSSHLTIDTISNVAAAMTFRCTLSNVVTPPPNGNVVVSSVPETPIPDNNSLGISDTIQINQALTIADIKVSVDITHTYRGDLQVSLTAPWGSTIVLHPKNQGGGENDLKVTYDSTNLPSLATWRGKEAKGAWMLTVKDLASVDIGALNKWSIELVPSTPQPVVLQESPGVIIPDNNANGISRSLATQSPGTIKAVEVAVDISHPYIGDLRVSLVAPNQTTIVLHNRLGAQDDNIVRTFTTATTPELVKLIGQPIAGTWKLQISDLEAIDIGKLNSWKVTFSS